MPSAIDNRHTVTDIVGKSGGPMDDMLTMQEAAAVLKVGRNTVYSLLRKGTIKAIKVGAQWRIRLEDLAAYQKGEKE